MKKDQILRTFSIQDLKSEIERRENLGGIFTVISLNGFSGEIPLHLIENDEGDKYVVQLIDHNIYDKYLSSIIPTCSDEDEDYDDIWEDYYSNAALYFIGKKIKIEHFKPYLKGKILK